MVPLNPESIRAFLRLVTLEECRGWCEHTRDKRVADALRPLLYDHESGAVRSVEAGILREELLRLALVNSAFRNFLEQMATLDRITAGYLMQRFERP